MDPLHTKKGKNKIGREKNNRACVRLMEQSKADEITQQIVEVET